MGVQWDTWDSMGPSSLSHGIVGWDRRYRRTTLSCGCDGRDGTATPAPHCVGCHGYPMDIHRLPSGHRTVLNGQGILTGKLGHA